MTSPNPGTVSYTEIDMWRRCQRKYYYSRVRNLEKVEVDWRPQAGTWMHELLGEKYRGKRPWYARHEELLEHFNAEVVPFYSDEDVLGIPELAVQLMERYVARYPEDNDWEVLHIEESFDVQGVGITPDLVVRTPGGIYVVDHKTSASIPEAWDLMADYQHLLYVAGMREIYGDEVKGAIFNYIRSKLPTPLRLNKTVKKELGHPDINNVAAVDTTYEDLVEFASKNDIPPYPALNERLAELKDADRFMRRFQLLTPEAASEQALEEAHMTLSDMFDGCSGGYTRTVMPQSAGTRSCNSCSFKEICQAELFGYDTTSAEMLYTKRTPLGRTYKETE